MPPFLAPPRVLATCALAALCFTHSAPGQVPELRGPGNDPAPAQEPGDEATAPQQEPARGQEPAAGRSPFAHLDADERITINFKDQDLGAILEMFSTNYNLNLVYSADIAGDVTLNLYQAPIPMALMQILATNDYTYVVDGEFLRVVPSDEIAITTITAGTAWEPRVIALNHIQATVAEPMLLPMLASDETLIKGPESVSGIQLSENLGGNDHAAQEILVFYGSDETLERMRGLLAEVDVPPLQVLVEATILSVSLSDETKIGVDFNALSGIDFQALGGSTNVTDGVDLDPTTPGGDNWLFGARTSGFTDSQSSGLHIGILRNQLGVFIEALESVGNATVLSNPQVLTVNRHLAEVLVGQRLPYITSSVSQTSTTQTVEFLEVGTSLIFRPFISSDGYVRMEIAPKNSSGVINSLGLPEETTTQVTANVMVKSGHTVVIGGLMETRESTNVEQVPLLGTLPFIGGLFRSESQTEVRTEIIVMLTPHIVGEGDLERRAAAAQERFSAARARLASSHHGYLRPSYARRMYREAAKLLAEGKPEAALAKAEWGLVAMPADPDLALLADHCHEELLASRAEEQELRDALRILEQESER